MSECARCGAEAEPTPGSEYDYCDECQALFDEIRNDGVVARSRHGNREFHRYPYEAPSPPGKEGQPQNQVEALAGALEKMEEQDCRGLFIYQKTGSRWLIREYLDAHPGIAEEVDELRNQSSESNSVLDWF